jgi:hypothetical protein
VGTINDDRTSDRNASTGKGSGAEITRENTSDTRNFIETHNVTKVARKATPGAGEESADLLQAEGVDPSHATGGKLSGS